MKRALGVVAVLVIIAGGYWYLNYSQILVPASGLPKNNTETLSDSPPVKTAVHSQVAPEDGPAFDPASVREGDMVGAFTVTEAGPYRLGSDAEPNLKVVFSGAGSVRGTYSWSGIGMMYLDVFPDDLASVPHAVGTKSEGFCFSGAEERLLNEKGFKEGDRVRVLFDTVTYIYFPIDGCFPHFNIIGVEKL